MCIAISDSKIRNKYHYFKTSNISPTIVKTSDLFYLIGPLRINFSVVSTEMDAISYEELLLKMSPEIVAAVLTSMY